MRLTQADRYREPRQPSDWLFAGKCGAIIAGSMGIAIETAEVASDLMHDQQSGPDSLRLAALVTLTALVTTVLHRAQVYAEQQIMTR